LHDGDQDKMLTALANWLLHVVKKENKEKKKTILTYMLNTALPFLQDVFLPKSAKKNVTNFEFTSDFNDIRQLSISSNSTASTELNQLPTLFAFQILLKMNKISDSHSSELHISDEQWPDIGKKLADRIWKSRKELNERKEEIQNPASLESYHSAFPSYLTGFLGICVKKFLKKS
jgi:hypothetical protein